MDVTQFCGYVFSIEAPIFWRWLWDCVPAGVRKSIKQLLFIMTRGCDKRRRFFVEPIQLPILLQEKHLYITPSTLKNVTTIIKHKDKA